MERYNEIERRLTMDKEKQPIILFDGVCHFCNQAVQFIIRHDKKEQTVFAALQSPIGQKLLLQYELPTDEFDSFIFIHNGKVYQKSQAALQLCLLFGGGWRLLYLFIIIPRPIRDAIYHYIAKNRYKWFGKADQCMLPTAKVRRRFLS
ncbi:thiol-disulfide oxidoreductase DCC family protein [Metabacillus niabensis]